MRYSPFVSLLFVFSLFAQATTQPMEASEEYGLTQMRVLTSPDTSMDSVPAKSQITLRHLLTHTAGLGYSIITKGPLLKAYMDNGITPGAISRMPIPGFEPGAPTPDLKTFGEQGVPVDAGTWVGFMAPANTPDDVVQRLNRAVATVLSNPQVREQLVKMNVDPAPPQTAAQFKAFVASEYDRWGTVIRGANIRVE